MYNTNSVYSEIHDTVYIQCVIYKFSVHWKTIDCIYSVRYSNSVYTERHYSVYTVWYTNSMYTEDTVYNTSSVYSETHNTMQIVYSSYLQHSASLMHGIIKCTVVIQCTCLAAGSVSSLLLFCCSLLLHVQMYIVFHENWYCVGIEEIVLLQIILVLSDVLPCVLRHSTFNWREWVVKHLFGDLIVISV